jgi:hypothetical protein
VKLFSKGRVMKDFAVVTYLKDAEVSVQKPNIIEQLYRNICSLLNRPKMGEILNNKIEVVELFKEKNVSEDLVPRALKIHVINLPFHVDELTALSKGKIRSIEEFIREYCASHELDMVKLPRVILEKDIFQNSTPNPFTGRLLFKSLITNILIEIYSRRDCRIKDLDMAVVQGKNTEELFAYIRLLAASIKYLTIFSEDKEGIEKQIEDFYEETGLSMRVTQDIKSCFKGINFILSLGELQSGMKLSSKAIVVNYGDTDCSNIFGENIVINGIEVKLPNGIASKLGRNVIEQYTQLELAEIILCSKLEIIMGDVSTEICEKLSREFSRQAFEISSFIGRRGILKKSDFNVKIGEDTA